MIVKSAVEVFEGKVELEGDGIVEFKFRKPSLIDIQNFQAGLIVGDVTAEELQAGKYKIDVEKALKADLYLLAFAITEINICMEWGKMDTGKRLEELEELAKSCGNVFEAILRQVKEKVGGLI